MSDETMFVRTTDTVSRRVPGLKELKIEALAENVNIFLTNIESVIDKAPEDVGGFQLKEVSVSAEVSADGKLVLMGTGVQTGVSGSLTFTFERKG
ncbi:MAG: hypothetical protein AAGG51_01065 [Cyanobacteria bacterium P01_G01_bin.54]